MKPISKRQYRILMAAFDTIVVLTKGLDNLVLELKAATEAANLIN